MQKHAQKNLQIATIYERETSSWLILTIQSGFATFLGCWKEKKPT